MRVHLKSAQGRRKRGEGEDFVPTLQDRSEM